MTNLGELSLILAIHRLRWIYEELGPDRKRFPDALALYPQEHQQPTSESDKYSTLREDLYAALSGFTEDGNALVTFYINPLLKWIWIGCWVILAGAIIAILEKRRY